DRGMAGRGRAGPCGGSGLCTRRRGGKGLDRKAVAGAGQTDSYSAARRQFGTAGDCVMSQYRFSRRTDKGGNTRVSFEFFPPKTDEMERKLWETVMRLEPLDPAFVSVTYGAGGSTRERTARTVRRILEETELTPAAHLTCVDADR